MEREKQTQAFQILGYDIPVVFCLLSGIVLSDPVIPVEKTLIPSPPPRPKNPVFDDEEKSKVKLTPQL